jgi:hypothetical protein
MGCRRRRARTHESSRLDCSTPNPSYPVSSTNIPARGVANLPVFQDSQELFASLNTHRFFLFLLLILLIAYYL